MDTDLTDARDLADSADSTDLAYLSLADTDGRIFNSSGKKLFILVNNQRYTVIVISFN